MDAVLPPILLRCDCGSAHSHVAKSMPDPSWMTKATEAARTLRATSRAEPGAKHSVYVVLLHDPRKREPWGLYVGQTSRDPDWRFDQHESGR